VALRVYCPLEHGLHPASSTHYVTSLSVSRSITANTHLSISTADLGLAISRAYRFSLGFRVSVRVRVTLGFRNRVRV